MKAEFEFNCYPMAFLVKDIQKLGLDEFTVYFFPEDITRLLKMIKSGWRMEKMWFEKYGWHLHLRNYSQNEEEQQTNDT